LNVFNNFRHQTHDEKVLLIVQNNGGEWTDPSGKEIINRIILESDTGVSQPMNVGLDWVRKNGKSNDWFCKFDDDDVYLPGYLESINNIINMGVDVTGRNACWVYIKILW
jgi:glycosyltransferase involved in cell wall biosynthesis